ncbi:DUF6182 family protein [Streptomyces sp. NPDC048106]|uniref:DUF6182 family protein n=1 Tax=Streptomyces sp. NPDC048106 TaxID=3155750 RepID=UPI003456C257
MTHILTNERLLAVTAERIRATRPDLVTDLDLTSVQELEEARTRIAAHTDDEGSVVVAVVRSPSLPVWTAQTCAFALALPADQAGAWRRGFTRTLHLAGQPLHLTDRFRFAHVAPEGSVGWTEPLPKADAHKLRRLLKTFVGGRELRSRPPVTVRVPHRAEHAEGRDTTRRPSHRELYYATAKVTVAQGLVHLNHLLVEAVMDGLIRAGDRITLRPVPRLAGLDRDFAAVRAETDTHRPHALQAYAALTKEL